MHKLYVISQNKQGTPILILKICAVGNLKKWNKNQNKLLWLHQMLGFC